MLGGAHGMARTKALTKDPCFIGLTRNVYSIYIYKHSYEQTIHVIITVYKHIEVHIHVHIPTTLEMHIYPPPN